MRYCFDCLSALPLALQIPLPPRAMELLRTATLRWRVGQKDLSLAASTYKWDSKVAATRSMDTLQIHHLVKKSLNTMQIPEEDPVTATEEIKVVPGCRSPRLPCRQWGPGNDENVPVFYFRNSIQIYSKCSQTIHKTTTNCPPLVHHRHFCLDSSPRGPSKKRQGEEEIPFHRIKSSSNRFRALLEFEFPPEKKPIYYPSTVV